MVFGSASNGRFPTFHKQNWNPNHNEGALAGDKSIGWMLLVVILPTPYKADKILRHCL
jgi:hypothetical protein